MRTFKILLVNFLSIILLLFLFEILSYREILNRFPHENSKFLIYNKINQSDNDIEQRFYSKHSFPFKVFITHKNTQKTTIYSFSDYLQKDIKRKNNKGSVVVCGCSMAYGIGLNDEQTIAFKLAQKLKKTTYNLAIPGGV